jgi:hypothetical protein
LWRVIAGDVLPVRRISRMIRADFVDLALCRFAGLALCPPCFEVDDLRLDLPFFGSKRL